jgi:hypothetical protein
VLPRNGLLEPSPPRYSTPQACPGTAEHTTTLQSYSPDSTSGAQCRAESHLRAPVSAAGGMRLVEGRHVPHKVGNAQALRVHLLPVIARLVQAVHLRHIRHPYIGTHGHQRRAAWHGAQALQTLQTLSGCMRPSVGSVSPHDCWPSSVWYTKRLQQHVPSPNKSTQEKLRRYVHGYQ